MFDNIFDSPVMKPSETTDVKKEIPNKSETKKLLKDAFNQEAMESYGTSKPMRVLIKAKISNG